MGNSGGADATLATALRRAATAFLDSLSDPQRAQAVGPYADPERTNWTYIPGDRPGVRLAELAPEPLWRATELLALSYSERGLADAGRVARIEAIRLDLPGVHLGPGPPDLTGQDYWLRLLGRVDDPVWAWRLSGGHLVAHATVVGAEVSLTPQFFGVGPARVLDGPYAGFRALPVEEDLGRQLITQLDDGQRRLAVQALPTPSDIRSRHDPVARAPRPPEGLAYARMDRAQRELFETLVRHYLDRAPGPVADRAWRDVHDAGIGELTFTWAGGLSSGQGHYYRLAGRTLLVEYDNTQDDANHIHSVWRDLRYDWGGDALARHYARHPHAH